MPTRTNAMRLLDARGIAYRAVEYDAGRKFHDAVEVAALLGAPLDSVWKTLVVLREDGGRPCLVMIPAAMHLDLKRCARAVATKAVRMASQREAEKLTGLQVGGISALMLVGKPFDVWIDDSVELLGTVHVSAGVRGLDLELRVADLLAVTGAQRADVAGA
ncbi:MAG: aminoacyl-tRNA deacylase [bacterium]|nr:aminoacyl-tRNA deacylase [bacterium]